MLLDTYTVAIFVVWTVSGILTYFTLPGPMDRVSKVILSVIVPLTCFLGVALGGMLLMLAHEGLTKVFG